MWTYLFTALGVSLAINIALFVIAFRRGTDKLTDASYAISFIALGLYGFVLGPPNIYRLLLVTTVTIWAARLGGFLLFRIWRIGKDSRFDQMRGNFWKFGKFWLSQGLAVWVILVPTLLALRHNQSSIGWVAIVGTAVWLLGVLIEATADLQKYHFTSNVTNKGKWIATGLWSWSRHPNYFGEIATWVGVYVIACSVMTRTEAILGLVSPLFIAGLLCFVSGIPILEKSADARWGGIADYRTYKKRTSILVPLPPKK